MRTSIINLVTRSKRQTAPSEVEEELQFHVEMLERKYAQQGMSASEAKAAASRRFGNLDRVKKQCVDISRRNSLLRRVLKMSAILIALIGLSIHLNSSDYRVARIGEVLIMIAGLGRLLLFVRGLSPLTFLPGNNEALPSVIPEDSAPT